MLNSRDINMLRPDVTRNCRIFIEECRKNGLPVLITGTVRDDEYQMQCVRNGTASKSAARPTFHSVKSGLAFDFCKNVKGHEYDDAEFFRKCGEIGKRIGFSWGGDWKAFPDRPHLQWDEHGKYTGSMILRGNLPPQMPEWEDDMDQAKFNEMMDAYLVERSERHESTWSEKEGGMAKLKAAGVMDGSAPQSFVTREQLAAVIRRIFRFM